MTPSNQATVRRDTVLELLARALADYYKDDPTSAGITVAWLPIDGLYYCSACRYRGKYARDKQVLAYQRDACLEGAVRSVAIIWLTNLPEDRGLETVQELTQALNQKQS